LPHLLHQPPPSPRNGQKKGSAVLMGRWRGGKCARRPTFQPPPPFLHPQSPRWRFRRKNNGKIGLRNEEGKNVCAP
jgi:hypothetical protein